MEFDEEGRLSQLCDADGVCLMNQYDLEGQAMIRFDNLGTPTRYSYDLAGNIVALEDGLGHRTDFAYGPGDHLARKTDAEGNTTLWRRDRAGRLVARVDPHPEDADPADYTTTFDYEPEHGELSAITLPSGGSMHFSYDEHGNRTEMRDGEGNLIESLSYDEHGRILTETDESGTVTHTYGDGNEPLSTQDPDGTLWTMQYDVRGELREMFKDGEVFASAQQDTLGRDVRLDFGDGLVQDIEYGHGEDDPWGSRFSAGGISTERLVSGGGRLTGWQQNGVQESAVVYDLVGRPIRSEESGQTVLTTYDDAGRVASVTHEELDATTSFEYDGAGRVIRTENPLGDAVQTTYYPDGRVETQTNERGHTFSYAYTPSQTTVTDPLGNVLSTTLNEYGLPIRFDYPDGTQESRTYRTASPMQGGDESITSHTDEMGRVRRFEYGEDGSLVSATNLAGDAWRFESAEAEENDEAEFLDTITSPEGRTWHIERAELDRASHVIYPDGSEVLARYNALGDPISLTHADGTETRFSYDSQQREIERITTLASGETETRRQTYTEFGQVQTVENERGTTTYHYDEAGRLSMLVGPFGSRIRYEYDVLDRVIAIVTQASEDADEHLTRYTYDAGHNLVSITDPLGGQTTYRYDALGRPLTRTLPNEISTTWTYDARGHILSVTHANADEEILASESYERNASGDPTRITRENGSYVEVQYDEARRIRTERVHNADDTFRSETTYTYDRDGNRLTKNEESYTYGPGFQLASAGEDTLSYDEAGRVIQKTASGVTQELRYNAFDQLTSFSQGGQTTRYGIDGEGRRVEVENERGVRRYLVAPTLGEGLHSPHLVTDESGTQSTGYVYVGEHATLRYGESGPVYYLRDAMGSVIALANEEAERVARFDYDAFGNERSAIGEAIAVPEETAGDFRHHGLWKDPSGLYYVRARMYDPTVGRFTSKDPIEPPMQTPEAWNPYAANLNNPFVYRDATGLFSISEVQVGQIAQNVLNNIARQSYRAVFDIIKDEALGGIANALGQVLGTVISSSPVDIGFGKSLSDAGNIFEDILTDKVCEFVPDEGGTEYLWLSVPIDQATGETRGDGVTCATRPSPTNRNRTKILRPTPYRGRSFPDFLISQYKPSDVRGRKKSWLIGDIKLSSSGTGRGRRGRRQLKAMARHAVKFSVSKSVLYITLRRGSRARELQLQGLAAPARVIIFSLTG